MSRLRSRRGRRAALAVVAVLSASNAVSLCAEQVASPPDPAIASFYEQVQYGNDRYIEENIVKHLQALHQFNQARATSLGLSLTERLDAGEWAEATVIENVQDMIRFQKRHNGRFAEWAGNDKDLAHFFRPLWMRSEQVKEMKGRHFPEPWPYVAIHWVPNAERLGMKDHEIPADGLDLNSARWVGATADVQRYAFFSFLRKACRASEFDRQFLEDQTGYMFAWTLAGKRVSYSRWQYKDYYVYEDFIPPKLGPTAPRGSLKALVIENSLWSPKVKALPLFYENKLVLFSEVTSEMLRKEALAAKDVPYLAVYGFVCRSFPCITAFRLDVPADAPGRCEFIKGYEGDRPSGRSFAVDSPFGRAWAIYRTLTEGATGEQRRDCARQILGPLLLLQFRLPDTPSDTFDSFPYEDLRVGFKGYLDLYRELIMSDVAATTRLSARDGNVP
jgi:hypothetical protein